MFKSVLQSLQPGHNIVSHHAVELGGSVGLPTLALVELLQVMVKVVEDLLDGGGFMAKALGNLLHIRVINRDGIAHITFPCVLGDTHFILSLKKSFCQAI